AGADKSSETAASLCPSTIANSRRREVSDRGAFSLMIDRRPPNCEIREPEPRIPTATCGNCFPCPGQWTGLRRSGALPACRSAAAYSPPQIPQPGRRAPAPSTHGICQPEPKIPTATCESCCACPTACAKWGSECKNGGGEWQVVRGE